MKQFSPSDSPFHHTDPIGQSNYQTVLALCYVIVLTGKTFDINTTIVAALDKSLDSSWASCLDRRQVWNQKRPPWFEAVLYFVYPVLDPIVHMLVVAVQTGATMYQVHIAKVIPISGHNLWYLESLITIAFFFTPRP